MISSSIPSFSDRLLKLKRHKYTSISGFRRTKSKRDDTQSEIVRQLLRLCSNVDFTHGHFGDSPTNGFPSFFQFFLFFLCVCVCAVMMSASRWWQHVNWSSSARFADDDGNDVMAEDAMMNGVHLTADEPSVTAPMIASYPFVNQWRGLAILQCPTTRRYRVKRKNRTENFGFTTAKEEKLCRCFDFVLPKLQI